MVTRKVPADIGNPLTSMSSSDPGGRHRAEESHDLSDGVGASSERRLNRAQALGCSAIHTLAIIDRILPAKTAWSERFASSSDVALFPEEEALIAGAAPGRRLEFATGRLCARNALETLGVPLGPIGRSEGRAPAWPAGIAASITHCTGYCAAAAARTSDLVTIGIDAEPDLPLPEEVQNRVAQPAEWSHLSALARTEPQGPAWDRLLFCAKEAVYKAWFPLTGRWLDFDQATVTIDPANRAFHARLLVPGPDVDGRELTAFAGRWIASDGLIGCAVAVAAHSA